MEETLITQSSDRHGSWATVLAHAIPLSVLIAGIMVSASILYVGSDGSSRSTAALGDVAAGETAPVVDAEDIVGDDAMIGDPDAPITIVEFSDFQCPFCRRFFIDTYPQIKSQYIDTGIANLVFRDFPLSFHEAAKPSAMAAECAEDQGKFWEYHDKLFVEQNKQGTGTISYGAAELKQWAREIGLDGGSFDQCLDSEKYAAEVDEDFEAGQAAGVSGTPSFFVNGTLLVGAQPFSAFEQAIEALR